MIWKKLQTNPYTIHTNYYLPKVVVKSIPGLPDCEVPPLGVDEQGAAGPPPVVQNDPEKVAN